MRPTAAQTAGAAPLPGLLLLAGRPGFLLAGCWPGGSPRCGESVGTASSVSRRLATRRSLPAHLRHARRCGHPCRQPPACSNGPMKEKAMSPPIPSEPVTSNDAASRRLTAVISQDHTTRPVPGPFTGRSLWTQVVMYARCAEDGLDPDEWFPPSARKYAPGCPPTARKAAGPPLSGMMARPSCRGRRGAW
jgi:hypothetical protein